MRDEDKTRHLLIDELRGTRRERDELLTLIERAAYAFKHLPFDHAERRSCVTALESWGRTARERGIA